VRGRKCGRGGQRSGIVYHPAMTWSGFSFLMTGVLLNAVAQLLLKAGTNALGVITLTRDNWLDQFWRMAIQPHFVFGVACYGISLIVWILGLSRVPVSVAYPMLSIGYVINAVAAYYLFGESVSVTRWLGIGCIIVGVWLVGRSA
jgi:multidrug transporter EmrE-like cation transporter